MRQERLRREIVRRFLAVVVSRVDYVCGTLLAVAMVWRVLGRDALHAVNDGRAGQE